MIRLDHSVEKNYAVADRVAPGFFIPVDQRPQRASDGRRGFFLAEGLGCDEVEFKLLHVGTDRGMPTLFLPHHPGLKWAERMLNGSSPARCRREVREPAPNRD
jgi:hypothetical protein